MEEARATYCFCGCGQRVKHPRLVVTNTNGWELAQELQEWTKLQIVWSRLSLNLSDDLKRNLADGQRHWKKLVEAIHTGERADSDQEAHAVAWRKHAKKARRKTRRRMRKDGLPDPFDYPDMEATELTAWITEGREPPWVAELDEAVEGDDDESAESENSPAFRLVYTAIEQMNEQSWAWDLVLEEAVVEAADKLSEHREEYNLVLDAIALGYWVRAVEREVLGEVNVPDPAYVDQLKTLFEEEPVETVTAAMTDVATGLPAPFAHGAYEWSLVLEQAEYALDVRREVFVEKHDDFADVEIGPELREFAFGLGYGLGMTVDALGIDGTRPRQS